jgi:membrane protease YdiL (CAAX protease family)
MKWIAPILAYLAVALGLFIVRNAWCALLGFHLAIIVSLVFTKPNIPIKALFTGRDIRFILPSVLLGAASGMILYFFWDEFGIVDDVSIQVEALGLNQANWAAFIAYFALANPLIEEYFWRGYLGSGTTTFYVSDFLYSGFHALILINKVPTGMIMYGLAVLVLAGWFWRQMAQAGRGLLAPVLGHMTADLTILLAVYLNLQG